MGPILQCFWIVIQLSKTNFADKGLLWSFGNGEKGQLCTKKTHSMKKVPSKITGLKDRVKEFSCGSYHCIVITSTIFSKN